jgi:hypothetical protein
MIPLGCNFWGNALDRIETPCLEFRVSGIALKIDPLTEDVVSLMLFRGALVLSMESSIPPLKNSTTSKMN